MKLGTLVYGLLVVVSFGLALTSGNVDEALVTGERLLGAVALEDGASVLVTHGADYAGVKRIFFTYIDAEGVTWRNWSNPVDEVQDAIVSVCGKYVQAFVTSEKGVWRYKWPLPYHDQFLPIICQ